MANSGNRTKRADVNIFCPRDGSKWYACTFGSYFVGCCKLNPCETGCEAGYLSGAMMSDNSFSKFPDASCKGGASFFTCAERPTFWGCCAKVPCGSTMGCAVDDIRPAFMSRPEQFEFYKDVKEAAPLTGSSGVTAHGPQSVISPYVEHSDYRELGVRILAGLCIALLVALPVAVCLWIFYRAFFSRTRRVSGNKEESSSSSYTVVPKTDGSRSSLVETPTTTDVQDISRLGKSTLYILSATSVVIIGVCGFLSFLWLGDSSNATWNSIMVRNWASRAVSISALLLRTAVDLQAAIATAVLVSLVLESRSGIQLGRLAELSPMRTCSTGPWTFMSAIFKETWTPAEKHRRSYGWVPSAIALLITTSIIQFSSTILLSDLKLGPLGGDDIETSARSSLSYRNISRRITRDSAWTSNPPFFPAFGEYAKPITASVDGISDTGMLLRSLLPYATAESRENLRSYTGSALVLDARVQCQAPKITGMNSTGHYRELVGNFNVTKTASMLQDIPAPAAFKCATAGPNQYTICQVGRPIPFYLGSLDSQFGNSTSYGTAFLVTKGFDKTSAPHKFARANTGRGSEWLDIASANSTTSGTSFSLCFAPWDASVLNVHLSSTSNRTEPQLQWWETFKTSDVVNHFLPQSGRSRQILKMHKPHSFIGDVPPRGERPLVQSDASGSSAAEYGSNMPLQENWSIFLTGKPLVTMLNSFSRAPSRAIAADPALAAIFTDTMAATDSVAWALSSLITVLSMNNYYSQQPAFDRVDTVTVSFFSNVLYPRSSSGFMAIMCALVAHFVVLSVIVVLFICKTRHTLLGNAWSAFSQMAESRELQEHVGGTSMEDDDSVRRKLKEAGSDGLRARIVGRGDKVEVVVE